MTRIHNGQEMKLAENEIINHKKELCHQYHMRSGEPSWLSGSKSHLNRLRSQLFIFLKWKKNWIHHTFSLKYSYGTSLYITFQDSGKYELASPTQGKATVCLKSNLKRSLINAMCLVVQTDPSLCLTCTCFILSLQKRTFPQNYRSWWPG